jgi:hypothetical protein
MEKIGLFGMSFAKGARVTIGTGKKTTISFDELTFRGIERKALPILAYMILRRSDQLTRRLLMNDIYGFDNDDRHLQLQKALSIIRHMFPRNGIPRVPKGGDRISFDVEGLDVDVVTFEDMIRDAAKTTIETEKIRLLDQAIDCFGEPIARDLEMHIIPNKGKDELSWLDKERDRLRSMCWQAYLDVMAIYAKANNDSDAIMLYERLCGQFQGDALPPDVHEKCRTIIKSAQSIRPTGARTPGVVDTPNTLDRRPPEFTGVLISRARTQLDSILRDRCYHFRGIHVPAVRIVGAAEEWFSSNEIIVKIEEIPYALPAILQSRRPAILAMLEESAHQNGQLFFNGQAVYLRDYAFTVHNRATEARSLKITLGPLDFFDYAVARYFSDAIMEGRGAYRLSDFLNVNDIAVGSKVRNDLSNIVDTATTLLTSDGVLIYSQRSQDVQIRPMWCTSAVAETMSGTLDNVFLENPQRQLPAPFDTVLRGIREELSPRLCEIVIEQGFQSILCLGMSFDLEGFHPNLLFLVAMAKTFGEIQQLCREFPGRDFFEGKLIGCDIETGTEEMLNALANRSWTPGGVASVIRTLEFVNSISQLTGETRISVVIPSLISALGRPPTTDDKD